MTVELGAGLRSSLRDEQIEAVWLMMESKHTVECTVKEAVNCQSTCREREGLRGLEMSERQQVQEAECFD